MAPFLSQLRSLLTPGRLTLAIALTALASGAYVVVGVPAQAALTPSPAVFVTGSRDGAAALPRRASAPNCPVSCATAKAASGNACAIRGRPNAQPASLVAGAPTDAAAVRLAHRCGIG